MASDITNRALGTTCPFLYSLDGVVTSGHVHCLLFTVHSSLIFHLDLLFFLQTNSRVREPGRCCHVMSVSLCQVYSFGLLCRFPPNRRLPSFFHFVTSELAPLVFAFL